MTTTPTRADALVAATLPYALTALGTHMLDHQLPAPLDVEVPGRGGRFITIWLRPVDVEVWSHMGITIESTTHEDCLLGRIRHEAFGVLDNSCIRVRLLWHTPAADHAEAFHVDCEGSDYNVPGHVTLCLADGVTPAGHGTVERACAHGRNLCDEDRPACAECRDDARQDSAAGYRS